MKLIGWAAAVATLIGAAIYMIVSLGRWQWDRALFFGLIVVIAEIAIATALLLRRFHQLLARDVDPVVHAAVRETRPASPNRFAWLERTSSELDVFIMFLVGGGVVFSGAAWLVDRLASVTSTPAAERQLERQLDSIGYPRGGLLVDDVTVLAQDVPGADDEQVRRLLRRAGRRS